MKHIWVVILLLGVQLSLVAQNEFKLVYYRGSIQQLHDKNGWLPLTVVGSQLTQKHSIKLADKSEAIFANDKGELIDLKQAGVYSMKDFSKYRVNESSQGFAAYYLKYVAGQITHKHQTVEDSYKDNLKNLGGVSRGHVLSCLLSPVNGLFIQTDPLVFSWKNFGEGGYTISIYSDSTLSTEVFSKKITDTVFKLSAKVVVLDTGKTYWWNVAAKGSPQCMARCFKTFSPYQIVSINTEYEKLKTQLTYSPGLNKVIEARFFEEKGYFVNAEECYKEALSLERDNETIKKLAAEFEARFATQ